MKIKMRHSGLLFLAIMFFPMAGGAVEGVRLVCDQPLYDFGRVDQSAVVTNVFRIRNEGDLSFVLKTVQTSCSCTEGRMDKKIIGPGETAELTAVFTAARRKGLQVKSLKLLPIDSDEPVLTFYMKGFVEPSSESN
jgi:hypothetical protein